MRWEKQFSRKDTRAKDLAERFKVESCVQDCVQYPRNLQGIQKPPAVLYYKGDIHLLNNAKSVAVIGSRNVSERGRKLARHVGRFMAENKITVVNGLAFGCDAEALKGALEVYGRCVAIMPCGLDQIVPISHQKLALEILENGGCLLSEYPEGTRPAKYQYVERDRLQSGVSQGVIVIEAELKSGTMHTADFTVKQNKRLACYYNKLLDFSSGNRYLEESGKAFIIKRDSDLQTFIENLQNEVYEQLSLF